MISARCDIFAAPVYRLEPIGRQLCPIASLRKQGGITRIGENHIHQRPSSTPLRAGQSARRCCWGARVHRSARVRLKSGLDGRAGRLAVARQERLSQTRLLRSGHRRVGGLHGSAVPMPPAQGGTALGAIIAVWVFGI